MSVVDAPVGKLVRIQRLLVDDGDFERSIIFCLYFEIDFKMDQPFGNFEKLFVNIQIDHGFRVFHVYYIVQKNNFARKRRRARGVRAHAKGDALAVDSQLICAERDDSQRHFDFEQRMIVSVEGPIGAGKSTLVEKLAAAGYRVFSEPVEAWTLLENFADDPKKHALGFQIEILISYFSLKKAIDAAKDELVVIERSPWSSNKVFFDMYIDDPCAKKIYLDLYATYAFEPDHILYLDVDEETSWRRVVARDRPQERGYEKAHVESVVARYRAAIEQTTIPVLALSDCETFVADADAFLRRLRS